MIRYNLNNTNDHDLHGSDSNQENIEIEKQQSADTIQNSYLATTQLDQLPQLVMTSHHDDISDYESDMTPDIADGTRSRSLTNPDTIQESDDQSLNIADEPLSRSNSFSISTLKNQLEQHRSRIAALRRSSSPSHSWYRN